jgi:hypothetical protein
VSLCGVGRVLTLGGVGRGVPVGGASSGNGVFNGKAFSAGKGVVFSVDGVSFGSGTDSEDGVVGIAAAGADGAGRESATTG